MKILITGSNGFIGKNLTEQLKNSGYNDLLFFNREDNEEDLVKHLKECNFIYHLAGVNRPEKDVEFKQGNKELTLKIINILKKYGKICPIAACSSIQAENETPYGISKKEMENIIFEYGKTTGAKIFVYRLPNVFGKWCRPNYNSAVATFCYNITRDLDVNINNPEAILSLVYIDDVVKEFIGLLKINPKTDNDGFCKIPVTHTIKLDKLVDKIYYIHNSRWLLETPVFKTDFDRKLYATYLSYLPQYSFSKELNAKFDERGYFCECLRNQYFGQVSVSITKPNIVRGNHWHNTKSEKFFVIQGEAAIKLRKIGDDEIIEYKVSGEKAEILDVPPGYSHTIENIGAEDVITLIWCNEYFDEKNPDTYFEKV